MTAEVVHKVPSLRRGASLQGGASAAWHGAARIGVMGLLLLAWALVAGVSLAGHPQVLYTALRSALGVSFFVLFSVGGIPEDGVCCHSEEAPPAWMRMLCALALLAVNVLGTAYPWITGVAKDPLCQYWYDPSLDLGVTWGRKEQVKNWGVCLIDTAACWITGSLTMYCVLAHHQPSRYIRCAVRFLVAVWVEGFAFMVAGSLALCGDPSSRFFFNGRSTGRDVGFFVNAVNLMWVCLLVLRRVRVLETTLGGVDTIEGPQLPLCFASLSRQLGVLVGITCALQIVGNVFATVDLDHSVHAYGKRAAWAMAGACCAMGLCLVHVLAAFAEPLRALRQEASEASPAPAEEARWAWRNLRLERNVIVMSMAMSMFDLALRSLMGFLPHYLTSTSVFLTYILVWDIRDIMDAISIAVLCGFLCGNASGDKSSNHGTPASPLGATLGNRTHSFVGVASSEEEPEMSRHPASGDPGWSEKVEELATRGFELAQLLDFLKELLRGEVMPSFDPSRSTTNDVVRQAIIPLSRERPPRRGGRALASVWSGGKAVWPERMVTHSWSNLFLHLVSAIVGDALGETIYYEALAIQLSSLAGLQRLRERLHQQGALSLTYWVCAFSVNQHAGICGGFGSPPPSDSADYTVWECKRKDTASGQPHAICLCEQPKFFSDQPVQCEMNKFDDMLDLLMEKMPGFRQVIAMDGSFDLLRRCWCLAEIVRTSTAGMPQNTLMLSAEAMDEHYGLLATLDVRDCQASNIEDKAFILGKIRSVERFNAKLQYIVFSRDGIFNRQLVDPRDRVHAAARVAARVVKMRTTSSNFRSDRAQSECARTSTGGSEQEFVGRSRTWSLRGRAISDTFKGLFQGLEASSETESSASDGGYSSLSDNGGDSSSTDNGWQQV